MVKILITGKNSYVGISLAKWLGNYPSSYSVYMLSLRDESWEKKDFSDYDVVVHVAGIAHIKESKHIAEMYYKVNRDLAFETAKKAKKDGVKQFIFLSSMSVYGIESGEINKTSLEIPKTNYGKSKLEAEELINTLSDCAFKVAILRPPMVYGKGCKGNYPRLAKMALNIPVFPNIQNRRSMIYAENLCEFIKLLIDKCDSGLFFPQNKEYVCSSEMIKLITEAHGTRIYMTKIFNPLLKKMKNNTINKVFGDLIYDKQMSEYQENYCLYDFRESVFKTEV
ncbi:NAD-dependent epimerase/dehydratase family protein [Bacillus sp. FJAT-49711]|uniref:NAD-dependent epimerase/dehydratase family protein n=1 Tax=Bacillus sp. FJAT-49711 TaxID=2833585 RepID=UPI001BC993F6|nr:NAD-dependent epimerase/dehydratase family protein [Bacillus sp. FJAT-49711]MBS4218984.1 NAD-dependent epimerase/dehydratase family protein [Bacillus sp. FJAT-49711]